MRSNSSGDSVPPAMPVPATSVRSSSSTTVTTMTFTSGRSNARPVVAAFAASSEPSVQTRTMSLIRGKLAGHEQAVLKGTWDQRRGAGRALTRGRSPIGPRRVECRGRPFGSGRRARGAGRGPGAGASADPVRPDGAIRRSRSDRGRGRGHGDGSVDARRSPGSRCRPAATRTSPTSGSSQRRSARSSSTSTTSTRPFPARGSGT